MDLTQPLSETTPVLCLLPPFANMPGLSRETISQLRRRGAPPGRGGTLTVGEHVGTHFDAPIHWITGGDGEDVASVPAAKLVGPAAVIDKSAVAGADANYLLTLDDVRAWESGARRAAGRAAGCSCAPAGTPARTTRTRFLERRRDPRVRTSSAPAGWPRSPASSASGSRPSGPTRALAHSFDPPFPVAPLPARGGQVRADPARQPRRAAADRGRWWSSHR